MEVKRPAETYVGLTKKSFKTRYTTIILLETQKRDSEQNFASISDTKIEFNVTWKILKQAAPFNPSSNHLREKYFIICS